MSLGATWLRLELRRRWRSLVVLGLLVALASGTVLASVAGARRAVSVVDRLYAQTLPADAQVLPNVEGFDFALVRDLPQVEALTTYPGYTGFGIDEAPGETVGQYLPADREAMRTIERPAVLKGRLADPGRADEAVVTENFVETFGRGVGSTVTLRLFTPQQVDTGVSGVRSVRPPRPAGPTQRVRIVGVVRSPWFGDQVGDPGRLFPSPALLSRYAPNFLGARPETVALVGLVRLRGGEAALPAFRSALARAAGRSDIEVVNRADIARHARDVIRFESACLLVFGLAALLAAVVLVGQSIARHTAGTVSDLRTLRAVGMTQRQAVRLAALGPLLAAWAGATGGVAVAILASRWLPFGAAANLEPAPGTDVDLLVLGTGWILVPALVGAAAVAAAWIAVIGAGRPFAVRSSAVARAAGRFGLPVPVVVGARLALEPGRGPGAVPVRPAMLGAVVGVLGVVAAFTFSAGVADAADRPERFGQTFQAEVAFGYSGQDYVPVRPVLAMLAADPDLARIADARFAVADSGPTSVMTFSFANDDTSGLVLTDGTAPAAANEVMLAPASARRLGVGIGSSVTLSGDRGTGSLRVTGIGFVPEREINDYDDGAWVTSAGYDQLFRGWVYHMALLELRADADPQVVLARIRRAVVALQAGRDENAFVSQVPQPQQRGEIQDIRSLPVVLGGFLGVLAVGAVGHALATGVRRRSRDVAVLRALGMTPRQSRGVVVTQATVHAAVGLAFGVPLGLALGRTTWRLVAETTPLAYDPPVAWAALLLTVPLAFLVSNLLAAWPGRRAAGLDVGQILRAE